jgi:hypothetical protein
MATVVTRIGRHEGMLVRHLAEAERHVKAGGKIVVRQRLLIARLTQAGCDVTTPTQCLALFENLHSSFVSHRDHVLRELKM